MHFFQYNDGELFAEDVPVRELVEQYGTLCAATSRPLIRPSSPWTISPATP